MVLICRVIKETCDFMSKSPFTILPSFVVIDTLVAEI